MVTVEIVYMDGITEMIQARAESVALRPGVLVVGAVNVERDKVRRWRVIDEGEDT